MPFATEERFIRDAEHALGLRFPSSFRTRLLTVNGGEVEADGDTWQLHPVFDSTDHRRIKRTANHIVRETQAALAWPRFPRPGAVVIGDNGTGDLLILQVSSTDPAALDDAVSIWRHDTGEVIELASCITELPAC